MARLIEETCHRCKEVFGISAETRAVLLRTHQAFYCPHGHGQQYVEGPSEADKLRLERDRLIQDAARLKDENKVAWATVGEQRERTYAAERRASAARGVATRLKNRAAAGVCPCCNRSFSALAKHMATKHPTFVGNDAKPEGATVQ